MPRESTKQIKTKPSRNRLTMQPRVANIRQVITHMPPLRRMANIRQAAAHMLITCKRLSMLSRDGIERDALLAERRT